MQRQRAGVRRGAGRWVIAVAICGGLLASVAGAENWPRFRGPNGQGLSDAQTIPIQWSEQDTNWRIELPGGGHASPVVWEDQVFVTSAEAGRGMLLCLDAADGKERWRRAQGVTKYALNGLNSYASPTPALDAERVYVLWPSGDQTVLTALTHAGQEVWTVTLSGVQARHGQGGSPIVWGPYVIVAHEQEGRAQGVTSQWLAVDRLTGQVKWRREEPPVENVSYSTPCVYQSIGGSAQIVFSSNAHGLAAVDPDTGTLLWEAASVLPRRVVSSPVIVGDMLVGTCGQGGRGTRLAAVRPRRAGQAYVAPEVYSLDDRTVPYVPTSVAYRDWLFAFHDNGQVTCLAAATGQAVWSDKPAGRFYGSPVCVNGILYCVTIPGEVVVLRAGPTYERLAVNPLGEMSHATPAVAGGRMYLRTFSHLISIGGKPQ